MDVLGLRLLLDELDEDDDEDDEEEDDDDLFLDFFFFLSSSFFFLPGLLEPPESFSRDMLRSIVY